MSLLASAGVSFHFLLSKYLADSPKPLVPHALPSTEPHHSEQVVHALLGLCSAGGLADAMRHLRAQLDEPDAASCLLKVGSALRTRARYADAFNAQQQALAIRKQALGDAHPDTAASLNNVGATLCDLGRHEEALQHEQQALAIRKQALGDAHPDTATSLNHVGGTLRALGRHEEALQHQQQALAIRKQELGDTHPDTATSLSEACSNIFCVCLNNLKMMRHVTFVCTCRHPSSMQS